MDRHTLDGTIRRFVCDAFVVMQHHASKGFKISVFLCRVELNTQDGTSGGNSAEAEALIHAAQAIFGLGGAQLLSPC